jgi:2,5-diamino-6-(ribosylamino)-4(3H)-pyrimidinone 5'-phosphate reductase
MPDRPRVTVHASISVDGSMTGFEPDLAAHYGAAAAIPADARLIGSVTMATGLDRDESAQGGAATPPSARQPLRSRPDDPSLPYWVVVDSTGRLHGRLDAVREFPPVRDVIVLVSRATPDSYLQYLADNRYRYLMAGDSRVALAKALSQLASVYGIEAVTVDSGPALLSALLDEHLVDEVSLLVHPVVVGAEGRHLFASSRSCVLALLHSRADDAGRLLLRYLVQQAA